MMGALTLITPPTAEPLTTAEAKTHLRITTADEDTYIAALVLAARQALEELSGRAFITQTWEYALNSFPSATVGNPLGAIWLPKAPLQPVTSITYVDPDGASQTLGASVYTVDTRALPGQIVPAYGQVWPDTRAVVNAVVVKFVAGFGDDAVDVPEPIRHAMRIHVGTLYEHREDVVTGTIVSPIQTVRALLAPYRMYWL